MKWTFNPFTGKLDAVGFYFKENGYTLELWFMGEMVDSWTVAAPEIETGQPIGLLLSLTYNLE